MEARICQSERCEFLSTNGGIIYATTYNQIHNCLYPRELSGIKEHSEKIDVFLDRLRLASNELLEGLVDITAPVYCEGSY